MLNILFAPFRMFSRLLSVLLDNTHRYLEPVFNFLRPFLSYLPFASKFRTPTDENEATKWLERTALKLRPTIEEDDDLLVHGRLREYAERVAPPAKYPELYCDVPDDLKRSIVVDGRTINGKAPAMALAGTTVTPGLINEAFSISKKDATFWTTFAVLIGVVVVSAQFISLIVLAGSYGGSDAAAGLISESAWDQWPGENSPAATSAARIGSILGFFASISVGAGALVSSIISFLVIALGAWGLWKLIQWMRFAGLVEAAINQATAPLRAAEAEAKERWRFRLDARELENSAYREALSFIRDIDHSPTISIGKASGAFSFRGRLGSPKMDQDIKVSLLDFMQHALITGASGEGKTRNVLKPLMNNLVGYRKSGLPVALFVMDDKSVLWRDLLSVAKKWALEDQVRIIGTEDAHWRVDLLDGTPPNQVADIVQSVAKQMAGETGGGDSFWPDMASQLILEIATLLNAHQYTDAGVEWTRREGVRVYSLRNILRVAQSDQLIHKVISEIFEAVKDDIQYQKMDQAVGMSLWSAIDAQLQSWASLADATKTGVLANARMALRLFAFNPVISRGFGDGSGPNLMSPADLIGNHLTAVAISALEHGSAGRLVLIALKSLLYRQARMLEARDPDSAEARLEWWRNPDVKTASASKALTFFIADEYQGLATKLEDEAFAAVARSTGTALIYSTQSIAAIETILGKKSTESLVNNLRTKIFLRSEDTSSTIEYVRKLAGSARRGFSSTTYLAESSVAAEREWGVGADNLPVASIQALRDIARVVTTSKWDANRLIRRIKSVRVDLTNYSAIVSLREAEFDAPVDMRVGDMETYFAIQNGSNVDSSIDDEFMRRTVQRGGEAGTIDWREVDVIAEQDMMQMGRRRAVVFSQRGGITRADIIKLNA